MYFQREHHATPKLLLRIGWGPAPAGGGFLPPSEATASFPNSDRFADHPHLPIRCPLPIQGVAFSPEVQTAPPLGEVAYYPHVGPCIMDRPGWGWYSPAVGGPLKQNRAKSKMT